MATSRNDLPGLTPIEILTGGRKSRAKPLSPGGHKAAIKRLVSKAPEVMVKVSGGGKTVQHVVQHLTYITRNGKLEAETDDADKVSSKDDLENMMLNEWGIDLSKGVGKNKLVHNIVLSMPVGTDPQKLYKAVKEFSREQFYGQRQYLMVLHEPETDPSKKKAEHPHVHLVIKAEGFDGKKIHIRKATLQQWRESFAEKLRDQGIEANATPRLIRGNTLRNKNHTYSFLEKRVGKEATKIFEQKFREVAQELNTGTNDPKPWNSALENQRAILLDAFKKVSQQYRTEGDKDLADALDAFAADLPPVVTERDLMKKSLIEAVKANRQRKDLDQTASKETTKEQGRDKSSTRDKDKDKGR